ncbi:MAG TPA: hypothetical protein VKB09_04900 [Thermomicrobiales bacterium]|nr:hypothetical protein [Thermomicrobiales bacterium]
MLSFRAVRPLRSSMLVLLALAFVLLAPVVARAQQATPASGSSVANAAAWLQSQQRDDGGFPGFSGESDAGTTVDAVLALAAAGHAGVPIDLMKAVRFLEENALVYTQTGPGQAAKLVLAIVAGGGDPGPDPWLDGLPG